MFILYDSLRYSSNQLIASLAEDVMIAAHRIISTVPTLNWKPDGKVRASTADAVEFKAYVDINIQFDHKIILTSTYNNN